MVTPVKLVFGVALGSILSLFALQLLFRLVTGLVSLAASLLIPLLIVGVIAYFLLRAISPRTLGLGRRFLR